ncbi:MAG: DUF3575 domain-containing protein [Tannerellaceae bacterium]
MIRKIAILFILVSVFFDLKSNYILNVYESDSSFSNPKVVLFFKFDQSDVDSIYRTNKESIARIDSLLKESTVDSISIISTASIDGDVNYNAALSARRSDAITSFLKDRYAEVIDEKIITAYNEGEDWSGLLAEVYERKWIPQRQELISLLTDNTIGHNEKKEAIKGMENGVVYAYLKQYVFWKQRNSSSIVLWQNREKPQYNTDILSATYTDFGLNNIQTELFDNCDDLISLVDTIRSVRKPIIAFKTNLLYDVLTALNVEVEVPLGTRYSVGAEWVFPFWKASKSDFTFNLLYGNVDVKYWLGDRAKKEVLTGWFCDILGGYGKFDFQIFRKHGAQGTFFSVGLGAGYAHQITRSLRLEYALGVGYIRSKYNRYDMAYDTKYGDIKVIRCPWNKSIYNWVGPVRAEISLVWMLYRNTHKRK